MYHLTKSGNQAIVLCNPEDIITHKLNWYRLGNEISEHQWHDAANVVEV